MLYILTILSRLSNPFARDSVNVAIVLIASQMGIDQTLAVFLITGYVLGQSIGNLFFAFVYLSAKEMMLFSTALLVVSTFGMLLFDQIWILVAWRFLQGLGDSGQNVAIRSIIGKSSNYLDNLVAKAYSVIKIVTLLSSSIIPIFSTYLIYYYGFKSVHFIIILINVLLFVFSTNLSEKYDDFVIKDSIWKLIVNNSAFCYYTSIGMLTFGYFYTYIGVAFFIQDSFLYSYLYVFNMVCASIGVFLNYYLLRIYNLNTLIFFFIKMFFLVIGMQLLLYCFGFIGSIVLFISLSILAILITCISINSMSGAINSTEDTSLAAGIHFSCLYLSGFIFSLLSGYFSSVPQFTFIMMFLIGIMLCFLAKREI